MIQAFSIVLAEILSLIVELVRERQASADCHINHNIYQKSAHTNMIEIQLGLNLLWRNDIRPEKVFMGMSYYSRVLLSRTRDGILLVAE